MAFYFFNVFKAGTEVAETVISGLEALGTIGACVVALYALAEAQKTRQNSAFNMLFTQLIASHKDAFADKAMSRGFFLLFHRRMDSLCTTADLPGLWEDYCRSLNDDGVAFSHAFKYVYHEVVTVLTDKTIGDKTKRHYIGIIQSLMTKDELFCYLVSLLQHFERHPETTPDIRGLLQRNHFFDDILREDDWRFAPVVSRLKSIAFGDIDRLI